MFLAEMNKIILPDRCAIQFFIFDFEVDAAKGSNNNFMKAMPAFWVAMQTHQHHAQNDLYGRSQKGLFLESRKTIDTESLLQKIHISVLLQFKMPSTLSDHC